MFPLWAVPPGPLIKDEPILIRNKFPFCKCLKYIVYSKQAFLFIFWENKPSKDIGRQEIIKAMHARRSEQSFSLTWGSPFQPKSNEYCPVKKKKNPPPPPRKEYGAQHWIGPHRTPPPMGPTLGFPPNSKNSVVPETTLPEKKPLWVPGVFVPARQKKIPKFRAPKPKIINLLQLPPQTTPSFFFSPLRNNPLKKKHGWVFFFKLIFF